MNYAWSTEIDSCTYSDGFKSVKECVQDAKNSGCKPYTVIYVGEAKRQEIRGIYFDEVLENVHDQMYSDVATLLMLGISKIQIKTKKSLKNIKKN